MGFIHIRLNFKDKCGKIFVKRTDFTDIGFPWQRMACHFKEVIQKDFNSEVGQGGTKEYRCLFTVADFFYIKFSACTVQKFNIVLKGLEQLIADHAEEFRRIYIEIFGIYFFLSVSKGGKSSYMFGTAVIDTTEFLTGTDRPVHWTGSDAEDRFNFIHQFKGVIGVPVHFVNKSENRDIPEQAYFKQFLCLSLNTLGGVDDHDSGVSRHQCTVSILREILMSRSIQNINAVSVIFKLQYRRGDGNTSLFFNFHPIGNRMFCRFLSFDRTGQVNSAAIEKEFLCQSGFARIRMGDDGKGSSFTNFFF